MLHCVNAWDEDGGETVWLVATNAAAVDRFDLLAREASAGINRTDGSGRDSPLFPLKHEITIMPSHN